MIIKSDIFEQKLELSNSYISIIRTSSQSTFRTLISKFWTRIEMNDPSGILIYDDDIREIAYTKDCELILSPFLIDLNSKRIQTALINRLQKMLQTEQKTLADISGLRSAIDTAIGEQMSEFDFSLYIDTDSDDLAALLKYLSIHINYTPDDLKSIITTFAAVSCELKLNKLTIFVNLKDYFSKEEIEEIESVFLANNMIILLIEFEECQAPLSKYERGLSIDTDFEEFSISSPYINNKTKAYFDYFLE